MLFRSNYENIQASKKILEVEYQKKQSELLAYRNQINPHFLYNTFECIRGMALYYEVPDIAAISESLDRFFLYGFGSHHFYLHQRYTSDPEMVMRNRVLSVHF